MGITSTHLSSGNVVLGSCNDVNELVMYLHELHINLSAIYLLAPKAYEIAGQNICRGLRTK